jgi:hypothetical protein
VELIRADEPVPSSGTDAVEPDGAAQNAYR